MSASYDSLGVAMLKEDGEILEASDSIKAHILKSPKKETLYRKCTDFFGF